MKLTATQETWNQCKATVYRDPDGNPWIAYTHEVTPEGTRGCYLRLKPSNEFGDWSVGFGKKEDRNWGIPYGDPQTTIETQSDIPLKPCADWVAIHSIGTIR